MLEVLMQLFRELSDEEKDNVIEYVKTLLEDLRRVKRKE